MDYFPRLYSERLVLRKLEVEDFPSLVKYANNPIISERIVNIPHPYREHDAAFRLSFIVRGFKEKSRYVFAIILKETDEMIGEISLHLTDKTKSHAQLAYWIGETFWNQGLVTEAVASILKFGFEKLNYDLIYADCKPDNLGSQKVLLKNDFQQQKTNQVNLVFKISKRDFENS